MLERRMRVSRHDAVLMLEFNNPDMLNALDERLGQEIVEVLESVDPDATPVVVMTGTGRSFCAGGDVKAMGRGEAGTDYMRRTNRVVLAMVRHDAVIVSAVNGLAYGGGFSLALASDIVFAASGAKFAMAHVDIGLVPDMGAHFFLPRITGLNYAKVLLWTGGPIDAEKAMKAGIVHRMVEPEQLLSETLDFAQRLAQGPRQVLRLSKRLLTGLSSMTLEEVLEAEVAAQAICFASADHRNRLRALLERHRP